MGKPALSDVILELHVPNFEEVKDFYGRLGFKAVWEQEPDGFKGYLVMKRRNAILCFWGGNDEIYNHPYFKKFPKNMKRGYAVETVIFVENIETYYEKVKRFAKVVEELTLQPWGNKDFRIEDPFGFYLRISEPYNTLYAEKGS